MLLAPFLLKGEITLKYKEYLNHIKKKTITLFLALVTAGTFTACSMNFTEVNGTLDKVAGIEIPGIEDLGDCLSQITDQDLLDLSDDTMDEIVYEIRDVAKEIETIGGVGFTEATLVRVVDGDTLVVSIDDNDYKVRLIGINTPESVAPESYRTENTKEGREASEFVKSMLSDVETVYLQTDVSNTDRYDRLLRYVWLELPDNPYDIEEVATKMLNGMLVVEQIAEPVEYPPDTAYAELFEELQSR